MRGGSLSLLAVTLLAAGTAGAQELDERELLIACLEGSERAAALLPEAEATAGPGEAAVGDLRQRWSALGREVERALRTLERDLAVIPALCAEAAAAAGAPDAGELLEAEMASALDRQAALVERACGSRDPGASRHAVEIAARLRERVDGLREPPSARVPEPLGLTALRDRVAAFAAETRTALARHDRAGEAAARVAGLLEPCVGRGESSQEVADLLERLRTVRARAPGDRAAVLESLERRARSLAASLGEREADQAAARGCLGDSAAGEGRRVRGRLLAELERLAGEAEAAARRAQRCAPGASSTTSPAGERTLAAPARPLPDVIGLTAADARAALAAAGFAVRIEVGVEAPAPEAAGTVAGQSPRPGSELEKGAGVTITIFARRE